MNFWLAHESARDLSGTQLIKVLCREWGYRQVNQEETPSLDRLHAESVCLEDYHIDPFCTPTREALMTGRYSQGATSD